MGLAWIWDGTSKLTMTASNHIINYLSLMIFPLFVGCGYAI